MSQPLQVGHFQTLEFPSADQAIITDDIYGRHTITEPVLLSLLHSASLRRLVGVCQHGITGHLGLTPTITRFEHSVGAFLLVRGVGGAVDEQVAALLHDISHTVLSHVMDWALSKPGESFHEVHKDRYLATTELPGILTQHGYADHKPFQEELYPLVERPSPHLCADRLDYALRDAVVFGKLSAEDAKRIVDSLIAHPDPLSSPERMLVLKDGDLGLILARSYLACDRDVWSNPAHVDMARRVGDLIGAMVRDGRLSEDVLWCEGGDKEFWEMMRRLADDEGKREMDRLEKERLPDENGMRIPKATKVRTIDPDIVGGDDGVLLPLSKARPEWAEEREAYIQARRAIMF
jgi:HD superfamily phosphohydrolase